MKTNRKATRAKETRDTEANASKVQGCACEHFRGYATFCPAGRPTKARFVKVYGPKGPSMTWA